VLADIELIPDDNELKYSKQDQQGNAAFNERYSHTTQWQSAQEDPKQKQKNFTLFI
jgi:hypothetical protein